MDTRSRMLTAGLLVLVLAGCGGSSSVPVAAGDTAGRETLDDSGPLPPQGCDTSSCTPTPAPECSADADCPIVRIACSVCPDGSAACPSAVCTGGQCALTIPSCPPAKGCGGFAGVPCSDGQRCIDDPDDDCDPDAGAADCPGVCVPEHRPRGCGGIAGDVCPPGYVCIESATDACDPATGVDCGGVCQPVEPPVCQSDADCPAVRAMCSICPDGSASCPHSVCANGQCSVVAPPCAPFDGCGTEGTGCAPGYVCTTHPDNGCDPADPAAACRSVCVPDDSPRGCGGIAGNVCPPGYECVDDAGDGCDPNTGADCGGVCLPAKPPACATDADCPAIMAVCRECADGTLSCPRSLCLNGECSVIVEPACAAPATCGGFAGLSCPPGETCTDDPNDDCDPRRGGADCPGVCVPDLPPPPPQCGGFAGFACPDGYVCVDDPSDDCDPATGGADCGGLCEPEAWPQCTSDAECPVIAAPCELCPDGTAACPSGSCTNGQCMAVFERCGQVRE